MFNIFITIDTDWAPDFILSDTFDLLERNNFKSTIFITHNSDAINSLKTNENFEVGWHPNFQDINNADKVFTEMKNIFPNVRTLRNHSLFHTSKFFPLYNKFDIKFTSNYLSFFIENIKTIKQPFNIIEYPIYFMDDVYNMMYSKSDKFKISSLNLNTPGLKVFAFHPIHIYLNSNSSKQYQECKPFINNPEKIKKYINKKKGIRNLFVELLNFISAKNIQTEHFH